MLQLGQASTAMAEKLRNPSSQTDRELLALLLRSADRADEILDKIELSQISQAHRNELGLTRIAYQRLQASIELGRRIQESKTKYRAIVKISGSSDFASATSADLPGYSTTFSRSTNLLSPERKG